MLNKMKNYYKNKPTQAVLMLVVFIWSVYEIGATSLASNSALTKEFMHSRYVMVWPIVDKKVKLYHYKEEWTTSALDGLMHLDYKNIKITGYPCKYGQQVFAEYNQTPNNNYDISFPLEGTLSEAYFSTLDAKYYLISENATIVEKKLGKNIEDLIQEIELVREEFSSVLTRMKILRLVYLILRMIVLLQFIRWSGQRRKRKENEILQNR
ncbi:MULTISPECIES: hypothetical protein [Streptococcus]|jgi:hypothetical protein|uniref:Uncharacterized protein n=1 Tax=Streptococcus oralis TaxID=1303 RepID=A0AAW7W8E2_STROR|nr:MULTISPECIES: hypothetical protein [Streptococcus]MBT3115774.1 hypothetical protein [Streptococcus oralis]MCC3187639.1 hypothetical protein [Streptococcus oralis]MCY7107892.1 hypothetical protein [Streptococcus oralis]MDO6344536.1 hypothetical protein [Streptococcus oralis]MDO6348365.1 hypothetical protein [Streptococcus oralis]